MIIYIFCVEMGKKDKKSKTPEQKARVAAKQRQKATQKEKKAKSKGGDDSDAEDVDLESVLEEYAKQVGRPVPSPYDLHTSDSEPLTFLASAISQGNGDTLWTTSSSFVCHSHRFSFERERTLSFRWRVLQWCSCHILQRSLYIQHRQR